MKPTWIFCPAIHKPAPRLILETREETLAYLAEPEPKGLDKYNVCSLWLCSFMDALEPLGYVYNSTAINAACKDFGWPAQEGEGTPLSALVYNCQGYRRAMALERDGWLLCTRELLEANLGRSILIQGEGNFGTVQETLNIRRASDGVARVFRPRKRKALAVIGNPCKIAA